MKKFNEFMNEETMPFAQTSKGFIGVDDAGVRDNINSLLTGATSKSFLTPYSALEKVSKVLANYHIFLPKYTFAEGNSGVTAFEVNQFGEKMGMTNQGIVKTAEDSPYFIYFEYQMNDSGMFEVFSEIVTEDELSELMDEYNEEAEEEDDEDEGEEVNEETSEKAKAFIGKEMSKFKAGKLHSGSEEGPIVKDPKQAIAIALDSARKKKLEEAAKKASPYHDSYSSAIQTAVSHAKKRGYEVDADDYQNKVASGPRKPSEGKTVSHNIKLTKDGKPTKKGLAIQVYNKGGETPFELNHYISEETSNMTAIDNIIKMGRQALSGHQRNKDNMELGSLASKPDTGGESIRAVSQRPNKINEVTPDLLSRYIRKAKTSGKRKKGIDMALLKKWGDKKYGLPEPKVKATNEAKEDDAPFEGGKKKKTPNPSKRTLQLAKKIEKAMAKYNKNK